MWSSGGRPTSRVSQNYAGNREPGGRRAGRAHRLRGDPKGISWPRRGRSIGCSCTTTTSCRNGFSASSAPRAGTASPIPRPCPATGRRPFRRSGGTTPRRRNERGRRDDAGGFEGRPRRAAGSSWASPPWPERSPWRAAPPAPPTRRLSAVGRAEGGLRRAPRHVAVRSAWSSRPTSPAFPPLSIRGAPKGGEFSQQIRQIGLNQNFTTFNTLKHLRPARRRRGGHGCDLRQPDGRLRRRTGSRGTRGLSG